jgi:pimeloyl-ACP methyl ester carboxylesterase
MNTLNVSGERISYLASDDLASSKTPILFVHGAGGSAHVWRNQIEAKVPGSMQVAVDLPGHARSEGKGAEQVEVYRDFVHAFVQTAGWDRFVLCGHSMGGAITQAFALSYPHMLEAIILVGTGARLRVAPEVLDAAKRGGNLVDMAYAPSTDRRLVKEAEKEYLLTEPEVRYRDFLACDRFDIMEQVAKVEVPALIICGEEDRLTPVKYSRYLEEQIPNAELRLIPKAGHMVMWEQSEAVNEAIATYLSHKG